MCASLGGWHYSVSASREPTMRSIFVRYLAAVLAVAVAMGLRIALIPVTGTGAPFVVFFAAVLLTSLYAGLGPALLAVAISAPLGAYTFVLRAGYPAGEAVGQALLFAVDGVLVAYLAYLITRSRRAADAAAAALRKSEEQLRKLDRRKDEFLAILSHELRNPLAAIRNGATVLARAAPDSEGAKRAREVIDRQSAQLTRLVDDLLDVTRIARGKFQLRLQRVELGDLVRKAIDDQRSSFDTSGIALGERLPSAPVWVEGDAARLVQVMHNLLSNAARFTPAGGRVELSLESAGRDAIVRVRDSGAGIATDDLERVFEPFVQVGAGGKSETGLGLGLALVKGIVGQHGGTVQAARSTETGGAELTVRLPLREAPEKPIAERAAAPAAARRRVLVIEDAPDVAAALKGLLTLLHQDVRVASEGTSALAMVKEFRPHLVLCDIALPGLDGYEIARRIRADGLLRGTVLVALTGHVQPEDRQRAAAAGFVRHLAKPATAEDLQQVLAMRP